MRINGAFFELSLKMLVVSNSNSMIQYRSVALEFVAFLDFLESGVTYSDTLFISTQVLIIVMNIYLFSLSYLYFH